MLQVGVRVEHCASGCGIVCMDNGDGTWNVEFDDDTEGDFTVAELTISENQSLPVALPPTIIMESGARRVVSTETESKPDGWTRFVCFSDTHGQHGSIPQNHYPEGDVLLHAGDFTNTGTLAEVASFRKWLDAYPAKQKIVIAGNHDITFDEAYYVDRGAARFHKQVIPDPDGAKFRLEVAPPESLQQDSGKARGIISSGSPDIIYLEDAAVDVHGYTIYGSPWQPEFCDWAFMRPRGKPMQQKWERVPQTVDVLLTHTPPTGFGDTPSDGGHVGCEMLKEAIQQRAISVNVFGHIHNGYGCSKDDMTLYINASTFNSNDRPVNPPVVFDLPPVDQLREATTRIAEQRKIAEQKRQAGTCGQYTRPYGSDLEV